MTFEYAITDSKAAGAVPAAQALMDDETFAGFYVQTARPLWAYLARVLRNTALADDLVQESFLRFLCNARWQDGEKACRSYLFQIASNLMRDHWRRPVIGSLEDVAEADLPVVRWQVDEQIDSQALLEPAFARLRPRDRQLLWLAYAEGATHAEIAQITGLGTTSIRLLLFRARRKLARLLGNDVSAERSHR